MKFIDVILGLSLPVLILIHLWVAPYTKVEESFNLQATHDILTYSIPTSNIGPRLRATYDHFEFPGAVPRTFVGAAVLAGISRPVLQYVGSQHGQLVVRAVLGLFNTFALLKYKSGIAKAFGNGAARWYILLQASQFHVIFYASRTLPNMFAFGLSTLAFYEFLPAPSSSSMKGVTAKRSRIAIYLLVLAGVIFRAELSLLLATNLLYFLVLPTISLQTIVPTGLRSAAIALGLTIPVDSYFWQRPIWPEFAGFFYNAIQGNSSDWGVSPIYSYFTSFLPKLLTNPLIPLLLIPFSFYLPSTRRIAGSLTIPSLAFVAIYSLQPHKEARFIIYVVPPLTACAALSASYIWTRRARSFQYRVLSLTLIASVIGSFAVSTLMLGISSLNYPGGEALWRLHKIVAEDPLALVEETVNVHMDVLSCMTGVSRFQQDAPTAPISALFSSSTPNMVMEMAGFGELMPKLQWNYDKTEDPTTLLDPTFWAQFDYVLAERPEKVIGKWEVVETIYGFAGIEILRPGDSYGTAEADTGPEEKIWDALRVYASTENDERKGSAAQKLLFSEIERLGFTGLVREVLRRWVTRGWWVGPRLEEKIRILRRVP